MQAGHTHTRLELAQRLPCTQAISWQRALTSVSTQAPATCHTATGATLGKHLQPQKGRSGKIGQYRGGVCSVLE